MPAPVQLGRKPVSSNEESAGAAEVRAEGSLCSLGSCCAASARDGDNRVHQLVSDLCFVFRPAYLYSSELLFFPQLLGCVLSSLSSIFPEQTLPFSACLSGEVHSIVPVGRPRSSPRRQLSVMCPSQEPSPAPRFPGQKPHTQPAPCEHGVCFARVTCLIISFSGGRLFLVSTVTAPLRGEAIRQRVKQVIKTLKPCARWEGGRASSTQ